LCSETSSNSRKEFGIFGLLYLYPDRLDHLPAPNARMAYSCVFKETVANPEQKSVVCSELPAFLKWNNVNVHNSYGMAKLSLNHNNENCQREHNEFPRKRLSLPLRYPLSTANLLVICQTTKWRKPRLGILKVIYNL
jgi:hypothetical protein